MQRNIKFEIRKIRVEYMKGFKDEQTIIHIKWHSVQRVNNLLLNELSCHHLYILIYPSLTGTLLFPSLWCKIQQSFYHPLFTSTKYSMKNAFSVVFFATKCQHKHQYYEKLPIILPQLTYRSGSGGEQFNSH